MTATPRFLLLSAALAAALSVAAPALAQDTDADAETVATATVPATRLADRYAELAGSPEAATALVTQLREGGDFTVTEEVTTTTTNADGTTTTTTSLVERSVVNPNGPMGYGEINISLAMAQALVDGGVFADLQSALTGASTTVTNPDGTTTTTVEGGVLAMRADGMGWGQIAKELGYNLGELVSASNGGGKARAAAGSASQAEAGIEAAADARIKAEAGRATAADARASARLDRGARGAAERPSRPERPQRPERPDRPQRGNR